MAHMTTPEQMPAPEYVRCWLVKAWVSEPLTGKWRQDDSKGLDQLGLIAGFGQSQLTSQLRSRIARAGTARRGRQRVALLPDLAVLSPVHSWNWRFTIRTGIYVDVRVGGLLIHNPASFICNSKFQIPKSWKPKNISLGVILAQSHTVGNKQILVIYTFHLSFFGVNFHTVCCKYINMSDGEGAASASVSIT